MTKNCVICGKSFETIYPNCVICSKECRRKQAKIYRERYKDPNYKPPKRKCNLPERDRLNMIKLLYLLRRLPKPKKVDLDMDWLRFAYEKLETTPLLIVRSDKREKTLHRIH